MTHYFILPRDILLYIDSFYDPHKTYYTSKVLNEFKSYYEKCPQCHFLYNHFLYKVIHQRYCSHGKYYERCVKILQPPSPQNQ